MYFISEFLQNRIHDEWWAFKVVAWYCSNRGIEMPKGRCHFGEIVTFYAPVYFLLGVLFTIVVNIGWPLLKYPTMPVWVPTVWFVKRAWCELEAKRTRANVIGIVSFVSLVLTFVSFIAYDFIVTSLEGKFFPVVSILLASLAIPFIVGFLAVWIGDIIIPKLQPVFELGREASQALQRPTLRQVGRLMVAPIKVVPVGARRGRDVGAILLTLMRDGWRKICPRLEYIKSSNNIQ